MKLPGSGVSFEALANYSPLISSLEKGSVVIRTDSGDQVFEVNGGIVEVLNKEITVSA